MFAAIAVVVAGVIYGTVQAAYPNLATTMTQKVQKVLNNDTDNESINLTVNLPVVNDIGGQSYVRTIHYVGDPTDIFIQYPIFEPNTFDQNTYDGIVGFIRPERVFNYTGTAADWEKNIADYYGKPGGGTPEITKSPFLAKTSDGKDITKNIRFKSVKLTQITTVDGHVYNDNTDNLIFNKDNTNYGEVLGSLSKYNDDHYDQAKDYSNKMNDDKDYAYIKQSKMLVTYTVSDDDGKATQTTSSILVTNSDGSPLGPM